MSRYRNTTNQPLVFDSAGHQVDAFGIAEVDTRDPRSSRHINARRLVLVPDPVEFKEPSEPEPEREPEQVGDTTEEPAPEPEPKPRKSRTRSNQKENEQ